MIPKIIHYCWLSRDPFPPLIEKCINSWKEKLPDYEIKCWNMNNFDIHSVKFVEEACSLKKWAFAADYIRLYALYTEGGIYLDSDVFVKKNFNDFLSYDFFTSVEYYPVFEAKGYKLVNEKGEIAPTTIHVPGMQMQAAILGGTKGHPFLKDCLEYYKQTTFILSDNKLNNQIIAPDILAKIATKYGFKYKNIQQILKNNMLILPSEIFASYPSYATRNSYAIHCCTGSWKTSFKIRVLKFLSRPIYFLFPKLKEKRANKKYKDILT